MKNPEDDISKNTSLGDDLDVFDEFEASDDLPEMQKTSPKIDSGGLDLEEFENELTDKGIDPDQEDPPEMPADPGLDATEDELDVEEVEEVYEEKPASEELSDQLLKLSPDVPVNLVAVIGKTTSNVGEVMKYKIGNVIDLGRPPSETVDLVANGRMIARGELVDMDGKLGVKILKLVK
ncbi:MAG: hypothetical protein HN337_08520 [Deltaproteobacteria bacterium]|jgi:flagellar motor switch protein FliN|nr:hypothetical protein [Deltaproteobacteria bacterium]